MTNKTSFSSFHERKGQEKKDYTKVLEFFERNNFEVSDVSEDSKYYNDDIDLFISDGNKELSVEVKIDSWIGKTNNFFLEIISNEQTSTPGCFLKSKADIWMYYDTTKDIFYLLPLKKLQRWFFELRDNCMNKKDIDKHFPLQSTHTSSKDGKYQHTTIGRKVNKDVLLRGLAKYNIPYMVKKVDEKLEDKQENIFALIDKKGT